MASIADRYLKKTKNKFAYELSKNKYPIREWISTGNLALNTLISADPNKGYPTGRIIQLAGPASTGKSFIAQECIKEAQKMGYTVFLLDSEGAQDYDGLIKRGIDPNLLVYIPIQTVRDTQNELMNIINECNDDDRILIVLDSAGNLATDKELGEASSGEFKEDMGKRAKEFKGMFRTITMPLQVKNIPMIVANHTYETLSIYSQTVSSGGCLTEGHKIMLADGTTKNIELIEIGDLVQTYKGPKIVQDFHSFEEKETLTITFEDGYEVTCTPEHKFLIERDGGQIWIEAGDLKENDDLLEVN